MKKFLVVLSFSVLSMACHSQYYGMEMEPKEAKQRAEKLKNTTLLVVLDDEQSSVAQTTIKAFDKYWKYNKYEFIKTTDIPKYVNNPAYSCFIFHEAVTEGGMTIHEWGYGIYLCTKRGAIGKKKNELRNVDLVHYQVITGQVMTLYTGVPVRTDNDHTKIQEDCEFALSNIIQRIQISINDKLLPSKPVYETGANKSSFYYNNGKKIISDKIVLVLQDCISLAQYGRTVFTDSTAKEGLKVNLEKSGDSILIVNKEQIQKAMEEGNANVVYLYYLNQNSLQIYAVNGTLLCATGFYVPKKKEKKK